MKRLVLVIALAMSVRELSADLVWLKDGSRRGGKVQSCDESVCVIGRNEVDRETIARIEFHHNVREPANAPDGTVILTDGSIHSGRFKSLDAATVLTTSGEIDRHRVALIIVGKGAPRDVVLFGDATQRAGRLSSCSPASCHLDGKMIRLDQVQWIGLRQEGATPPDPHASTDLVYVGGKAEETRMSSLNAKHVGTTHGSFDRESVTWMHFAGSSAPPQPQPIRGTVEDTAATSTSGGEDTTTRDEKHKKTTDIRKTKEQPHAGATWSGFIEGRMVATNSSAVRRITMREDLVLREIEQTPLRDASGAQIGTHTKLRSESASLRNHISGSGSTFCIGEGTTPVEEITGSILHKTRDGQPFGFVDFPAGREVYTISVPAIHRVNTTYKTARYASRCQARRDVFDAEQQFFAPFAGLNPLPHPKNPIEDTQYRFVDAGKMIGNYSVHHGSTDYFVQWAICREGVICPTLPSIDEPQIVENPKTPCPDVEPLIRALNELRDDFDKTNKEHHRVEQDRDAIRDKIWGYDGALRKYFTSLMGLAGKALKGPEADLVNAMKTILNLKGDAEADSIKVASAALPPAIKNLAANEAVKSAAMKAGAFFYETQNAEGAADVYNNSMAASQSALAAGSDVAKVFSVAGAMNDYFAKTSKLENEVRRWAEKNEDATRLQNELDDISRKMEELNEKIKAGRDRCAGHAALDPLIQPAMYMIDSTPPPSEVASVVERLQRSLRHIDDANREWSGATVWLLPLGADLDKPLPPPLVRAFAARALPHLENAQHALDAASEEGKKVESELRRAIPEPKGK